MNKKTIIISAILLIIGCVLFYCVRNARQAKPSVESNVNILKIKEGTSTPGFIKIGEPGDINELPK